MRVYCEGSFETDERIAKQIGLRVSLPDDADCIMFCGGSDISPHLYGEKREPRTSCSPTRDEYCVKLYSRGLPSFGICRGAQFLAAMNGGKLWQHVEEHERTVHTVVLAGRQMAVNSFHHQAIRPGGKFMVEGFALLPNGDVSAEAISGKNFFGVQYHPEWMKPDAPAVEFFIKRVRETLGL